MSKPDPNQLQLPLIGPSGRTIDRSGTKSTRTGRRKALEPVGATNLDLFETEITELLEPPVEILGAPCSVPDANKNAPPKK